MSSTSCDQVAERVALGEPLGEMGEHAATCERCKRLVALPVELGATRREADPGLGFSARMTAGAQHRIGVRRRQRIAGGLAAAVAATTLGVFAMTRQTSNEAPIAVTPPAPTTPLPASQERDPWNTDEPTTDEQSGDEDVRSLVQLANTDRAMHASADWESIQEPLSPYDRLLKRVSHE
jgi:hypothetical protein